ncbi:MAG TPA: hypothetical protein VHZ31_09450 [Solirubrobacteraceae bacterium]|nr:hypothetical protein [Solirubrobacteraceae bacterium]
MPELKRTIVSLSLEQHEWLRTRSFHERISMAEIIRRLIEEAQKREEQKRRRT